MILIATLLLALGAYIKADAQTADSPLIIYDIAGVMTSQASYNSVRARIGTCNDFEEILITVNRLWQSSCAQPVVRDNPLVASGGLQIRMNPTEQDIVAGLSPPGYDTQPYSTYWRLTQWGMCVGVERWTSTVGCAGPDTQGLATFGLNARMRAPAFDAYPEQYPANVLIMRQAGTVDVSWRARLQNGNASNALIWYSASDSPIMKFEQDGSVWVWDTTLWRRL